MVLDFLSWVLDFSVHLFLSLYIYLLHRPLHRLLCICVSLPPPLSPIHTVYPYPHLSLLYTLSYTITFPGITKFNLLGRFGSFQWLGSFWLVLLYNSLFFALTVTILLQRVTRPLLQEAASLLGAMLWSRRDKRSKSPLKMIHND